MPELSAPRSSTLARTVVAYSLLGAALGALYGACSLRMRDPERTALLAQHPPPRIERCPAGYVRAPGYDSSALLGDTDLRWLVRCDPVRTEAALSESLELFWQGQIRMDRRLEGAALEQFLRATAQSSHVVTQPPRAPERVTLAGVPSLTQLLEGALRVPALTVRVWLLPAGDHTLEVQLVAPRDRYAAALTTARSALQRVHGLAAWTPGTPGPRAWRVQASCPEGWTDATPEHGGDGAATYTGRYCLAPSGEGGVELSFTELAAHPEGAEGVASALDLARTRLQVVGGVGEQHFSAPEAVTIDGQQGHTAELQTEPPPANVQLRGYLLPTGDATVYALALSMHDHAERQRQSLERWMGDLGLLQPDAMAEVQRRWRERTWRLILLPALLTAALGAALAFAFQKRESP